jgi:hypothetical protein
MEVKLWEPQLVSRPFLCKQEPTSGSCVWLFCNSKSIEVYLGALQAFSSHFFGSVYAALELFTSLFVVKHALVCMMEALLKDW